MASPEGSAFRAAPPSTGMSGVGMRFFLACSRFNGLVTQQLLGGATDALTHHGVSNADVEIAWVPGAFELPLVARLVAQSGRFNAVIALGAVIRGETSHYEIVANQTAAGIQRASLDSGIPVIFGVLTTDTLEQALERAGGKAGNKGYDAAMTALEMARLLPSLFVGQSKRSTGSEAEEVSTAR